MNILFQYKMQFIYMPSYLCMKVNDSLTCSRWVCTIILYIYHSYHSKFWFLHIDLEYMACIIIFSVRMLLYFPWIYIMQRFLYLSKNKQANSVGNPQLPHTNHYPFFNTIGSHKFTSWEKNILFLGDKRNKLCKDSNCTFYIHSRFFKNS